MTSRRSVGAALIGAAFTVLAFAPPAQAAVYGLHADYKVENLRCGYFVTTVNCATGVVIDPIVGARAGDVFNLSATFDQRVRVGGSKMSSLAYIGIGDSTIVLGQGAGSGPYLTRYRTDLQGYQGALPLFKGGPFSLAHNSSYIGIAGHVSGLGIPSDGFSFNGMTGQLTALTDAPRMLDRIYVGYSYQVPNAPASVVGTQGGSVESPVILPPGQVGQVTANIGGAFGADQFYGFRWSRGGLFQTFADVRNADPSAIYQLQLLSSDRTLLHQVELNAENQFRSMLNIADLGIGDYVIGIGLAGTDTLLSFEASARSSLSSPDVEFTLNFGTPVGSVPEPQSWAMMILGLGFAGAALRRQPRRLASI